MQKNYQKKSFSYGWVIIFISGLGVFFSGPGQTYNVSMFLDSFIGNFNWSRSLVSATYSLGSVGAGLAIGLVGLMIDRFGHRKSATIIVVLLGASCVWMIFISNVFMLFFGFFLIRLLGQGSMSVWPPTLVSNWFNKRRGLALSIMGVGGMAASAAFPPISNWLISTWGWQIGWQFWGAILLVFMAPLTWFLIRNHPRPKTGQTANVDPDQKEERTGGIPSFSLKEARKTFTYWLVLFCLFVPSMLVTGISFHIVSILGIRGLSPTVAATTLSVMAIVGFPFSLLAGYIYDRIKIRSVLIIFFTFYLFTFIWLQNVDTLQKSIVYGILMGIVLGFLNVTINIVGPNYFGLDYLGSIRGSIQSSLLLGSALGPIIFGFSYDYFGGYTEILWITMLFPAMGVVASSFLKIPIKNS